jgi:acetyl esterase
MGLDPQAQAFLQQVAEAGLPPMNELSPDEARAQARVAIELVGPGPDVASVENFAIPTTSGQIAARRYVPEQSAGTIVWLHGGGWVICDLETHDAMCRILANESGYTVIAVDYRLAPEYPFPAPLEDCWDALSWVAEHRGPGPLVLGGDSAGGNLTAVCTLRARDRGGPTIDMQILVYPATDHDMSRPSHLEHGSGPETFLTTDEMVWFTGHYLPDPGEQTNPEVSPLRADSHEGLPPAVVLTAEYDPLRDDGLAYVDKLREAGVPVTHRHYDGMIHAFFTFVNVLDKGNEAVAQVAADVRGAAAPPTTETASPDPVA